MKVIIDRYKVHKMNRILILVLFLVGAIALASQSAKLYLNGNVASSGIIERNGVAYVPLKDVASALKLNLKKTSRGYELTDAGGANAIGGISGKVGDVLWNGFGRFQIVEVIRTQKYKNRFSGDNQEVTPFPEDFDLVIVVCRIKNGMKDTVTCGLPSGINTALTDTKERSFGPRSGLSIDCPSRGQTLLPGAAVDFALTFDVPKDAVLKDLVYELQFFGVPGVENKKFRVNL